MYSGKTKLYEDLRNFQAVLVAKGLFPGTLVLMLSKGLVWESKKC